MLNVMKKKCDQCLFSKDRIVSQERASQLINECKDKDTYFICHKGTIAGKAVVCRGYWDIYKNDFLLGRVAQALDCVKFIWPKINPRGLNAGGINSGLRKNQPGIRQRKEAQT